MGEWVNFLAILALCAEMVFVNIQIIKIQSENLERINGLKKEIDVLKAETQGNIYKLYEEAKREADK